MQTKAHCQTVLFVSNGHGEDTVGAQIARRVQVFAGDRLRLLAFPIVGAGNPYRQAGIPVVGPQAQLPSGGFGYLNIRNAIRDVLAGGVGMALRQLRFAWRHRDEWDAVVGVGDRVSLHLNDRILKKPMIWVAIAYSIRFVPPGGRFGSPGRWRPLLDDKVEAFVRDVDTQAALKAMGYPSRYVGNPMRDGLEPNPETRRRVELALRASGWDGSSPVVALLPGSRKDALLNLPGQLEVFKILYNETGGRIAGIVAWAPLDTTGTLAEVLKRAGWILQVGSDRHGQSWQAGAGEGVAFLADGSDRGPMVPLVRQAFPEILDLCTVVLGQAGTAVEQAVGLGKPAVTFPGKGMQVTPRFLAAQGRLLRGAVVVSDPAPRAVAREVLGILADPERYRTMAETGRRLMGLPGATDAIARRIVERFALEI